MEGATCQHCGAPIVGGGAACSTGCDLARRLPRGEEDLPVTWQLGVLLAWGFALFNQFLFAGLLALSISREQMAWLPKFAVASFLLGLLVFAWSILVFLWLKPKKILDYLDQDCTLSKDSPEIA